jgi:hypothetical protein
MPEADTPSSVPLVLLTATEKGLEDLLLDLELHPTSSESNESVHHCKRGIERIGVVMISEDNLPNSFDTEYEPLEEPATGYADVLSAYTDDESLCEATSATASAQKNSADCNSDCSQVAIDQIIPGIFPVPSMPIAKTRKKKESEVDFDEGPVQQAIADEIHCRREQGVVLLDLDYHRLRRKFRLVSFAEQRRVINGLRAVMEELEVGLSKRPE